MCTQKCLQKCVLLDYFGRLPAAAYIMTTDYQLSAHFVVKESLNNTYIYLSVYIVRYASSEVNLFNLHFGFNILPDYIH